MRPAVRAARAARSRRAPPRRRRRARRGRTGRSPPPRSGRRRRARRRCRGGCRRLRLSPSVGMRIPPARPSARPPACPLRPARRRAIAGSAARSSESDPNAPGRPANHFPIPARASFIRAIGSKLPVRRPSVTPSRPASQGSSSGMPGTTQSLRSGGQYLAKIRQHASWTSRARSSIRRAETPRSSRISRAISPSVRPAGPIFARRLSGLTPCTSRIAPSSARLWAPVAADSSVPSMSNRRSTQRSNEVPGSSRRANAAINRAAASTSAIDTISIGECM